MPPNGRETGREASTASRVRKHREKLRTEHYGRVDVWISSSLINLLRQLAVVHGRGMAEEIHDATIWYLRRLLNLSGQVTMAQANEAVERYHKSRLADSVGQQSPRT